MNREEIGSFAGPIYEALKDGKTLSVAECQQNCNKNNTEHSRIAPVIPVSENT